MTLLLPAPARSWTLSGPAALRTSTGAEGKAVGGLGTDE